MLGIGPNRDRRTRGPGAGRRARYLNGYDRFDKTQFQVNTVKTFSNVLGAENMLIVGEVGAQWNNVPDYTKGARPLRPRLHVRHGLEPGLRGDSVAADRPGYDLLADILRDAAGAGPEQSLYNPSAERLQERRLRDGHRLGLSPARVDGLQQRLRTAA